jgi:hypothetical protein
MPEKTYHGSCECGKIQFEATLDLSKGTFKCNCRMCTKSRFWGASLASEELRVMAGESEISLYGSNPVHHFCRHCGIKVFGRGELPEGKKFSAVSLASLDDLDPREWVSD